MGYRFNSRIYTNSFAIKEQEMTQRLYPKTYFGFPTRIQYSYNVYHQLANNGASFGARGARWDRYYGQKVAFIPPY